MVNKLQILVDNIGGAAVIGATAALPIWAGTSDHKAIAIGFLGPFLASLARDYGLQLWKAPTPPAA